MGSKVFHETRGPSPESRSATAVGGSTVAVTLSRLLTGLLLTRRRGSRRIVAASDEGDRRAAAEDDRVEQLSNARCEAPLVK
jgi:hypothetical protein